MKVKKIKEIDAVWCTAETDEGEKHLPIEEAKKLMKKSKDETTEKPKPKRKPRATKKSND